MAQVEVGRKENDITKAAKALKLVEISQKVVTGDALHTQKRAARHILDEQGDFMFPLRENVSSVKCMVGQKMICCENEFWGKENEVSNKVGKGPFHSGVDNEQDSCLNAPGLPKIYGSSLPLIIVLLCSPS